MGAVCGYDMDMRKNIIGIFILVVVILLGFAVSIEAPTVEDSPSSESVSPEEFLGTDESA